MKPDDKDDRFLLSKGYRHGDRVLLFDGVCVLCNAGVDFILRHDTKRRLKMTALQGEVGKTLLRKYNAPTDLSTVVLIQENKAYTKSAAIFNVGKNLNWYLSIPSQLGMLITPGRVADYIYTNWIANKRYQLFGKKDECRLVEDSDVNRSRFLI